jgi:sensor histidine kinase YesM
MMLQILIENAIKHGLEPKIDGGRIDIRAAVDNQMLQVDVIDDGVGFNPFPATASAWPMCANACASSTATAPNW